MIKYLHVYPFVELSNATFIMCKRSLIYIQSSVCDYYVHNILLSVHIHCGLVCRRHVCPGVLQHRVARSLNICCNIIQHSPYLDNALIHILIVYDTFLIWFYYSNPHPPCSFSLSILHTSSSFYVILVKLLFQLR